MMQDKKTGRGGARKNAGRKPKFTLSEQMIIGGECQLRWLELAEQNALSEYEQRPYVRDIRREQLQFQRTPVEKRRDQKILEDLAEYSEGIEDILEFAQSGKDDILENLPKRSKPTPILIEERHFPSKEEIITAVGAWCEAKYGKRPAPTSTRTYWDAHVELEKRLKTEVV